MARKTSNRERTTKLLENLAQDGCRIIIQVGSPGNSGDKPIKLWDGLGNRAGLHSFANELLAKRWRKSGQRFLAKLAGLSDGTVVTSQRFHNITRDRGRWRNHGNLTL